MLCNTSELFLRIVGCAALLICSAASASADVVASHAGPTDFNGTSDYVTLEPVAIGSEGRIDLEFKANDTSTLQQLWYLTDVTGNYEYQLAIKLNGLYTPFYQNGYIQGWSEVAPFTDTSDFHSLSLQWKDGDSLKMTLDGSTYDITGALSLSPFDSSVNELGRLAGAGRYFSGTIRNVEIRNTYAIPEPTSLVLSVSALLGMIAYAWRKRR